MPAKKATKDLARNQKLKEVPKVYETMEDCIAARLKSAKKLCESTDFLTLRCSAANYIENNVLGPLEYCEWKKTHKNPFTAQDLKDIFNLLLQITNVFNEKVRYEPTIATFCRLACLSMNTFNAYTYQNDDLGDMAMIIQDYFKASLMQTMINGNIHPAAGQFIGKAALGMREGDSSNLNINVISSEVSLSDILSEYEKNKK